MLLELALQRYALDLLIEEGFTPTITPDLARNEILQGIGFIPRGPETQIYSIDEQRPEPGGHGRDHARRHVRRRRSSTTSSCRSRSAASATASAPRPAPAAGARAGCTACTSSPRSRCSPSRCPTRATRCTTTSASWSAELFDGLGIPYRVIDTATGDLGGPAYRKFDLEAWMPGRGDGGRIRRSDQHQQLHRLPGPPAGHPLSARRAKRGRTSSTRSTAPPSPSAARMIAVLENYQQADGSVMVPEVLRAWMGKERIG